MDNGVAMLKVFIGMLFSIMLLMGTVAAVVMITGSVFNAAVPVGVLMLFISIAAEGQIGE